MMNDLLIRLAVATGTDPNSTQTINIPEVDANTLLLNGLNLTYFLAGVIAVITIIIAGIMYTSSNGDTGRVTKSKNLMLYAIIGLVVILVAFGITNFVIGRFSS